MPRPRVEQIDLHIGRRLRIRREEMGLALVALGDRVGLSGQQVQKYETGENRISASRLFDLAEALGVPISWFFHGVTTDRDDANNEVVALFVATPEGAEIAKLWPGLSLSRRQELLQLMRKMDWAPQ